MDKSSRCGSSCDYLHPDHYEEENKKIPNEMKVKLENLKKNSKEGTGILKTTIKLHQKRY